MKGLMVQVLWRELFSQRGLQLVEDFPWSLFSSMTENFLPADVTQVLLNYSMVAQQMMMHSISCTKYVSNVGGRSLDAAEQHQGNALLPRRWSAASLQLVDRAAAQMH